MFFNKKKIEKNSNLEVIHKKGKAHFIQTEIVLNTLNPVLAVDNNKPSICECQCNSLISSWP